METQRSELGRPFITRFVAGLVIGLGAMGGLFAVASAAASGLKVDFATIESDSHRRNYDFEVAHPGTTDLQALQQRGTRLASESK